MTAPSDPLAEAIGWHLRLRDAGDEEWLAFTRWLEESPANASAYEEVALADGDAGAIGHGAPRAANDEADAPLPASPRITRRALVGLGVAAALVGIIGYRVSDRPAAPIIIATAPGETRVVPLAEDGRVTLNGSTRLVLDTATPHQARLEAGEALFEIVHDPRRAFSVEVGDATVRDLGTTFNIVREGAFVEVGVAEGEVAFSAPGAERHLRPGDVLRRTGTRVAVERRAPGSVGGWREGRLNYAGAPISTVAADLSRSTGLAVRADPSVASRTFSGTVALGGDRERLIQRASALLGVSARREGEGWVLTTAQP